MKKWLIIMLVVFLPGIALQAQNDDDQEGSKVEDRMSEYIQTKLGLNKDEAEKFKPVFSKYFREFVQTHREYRTDKLMFQKKIIELRLRYRTEFRQILDELRANKVYVFEDQFRKRAIEIIRENRRGRLPGRNNNIIRQ